MASKAGRHLTSAQRWIVLSSILTALLGLGNLGRAIVALRYAARLQGLPTTASLYYLAGVAGFWGVVFVACTVGLSFLLPWGRWLTLAAVTLHQAHTWANHLLFDESHYARQTYPRDLALTLALLLLFWGSLNLPSIKKAFGADKGRRANRAP